MPQGAQPYYSFMDIYNFMKEDRIRKSNDFIDYAEEEGRLKTLAEIKEILSQKNKKKHTHVIHQ